jgi:hypothetical protein
MAARSPIRFALFLAPLFVLGLTAPIRVRAATSAPVSDQAQTVVNAALSVRKGTNQTFTVGMTGTLTRVDLPLCTRAKGNSVVLQVVRKSSPQKSLSIPEQIALSFGVSSYKCNWDTFTLAAPMSVTAGEVLDLVVMRVKGFAPLWGVDNKGGDPYPRGVGTWQGHTINDFAFRTWVAP